MTIKVSSRRAASTALREKPADSAQVDPGSNEVPPLEHDNPETISPPADQKESEISGGNSQQSTTVQFVTFLSGDEVFAVDMEPVKEIIRVPEVVRVPLAPTSLNGLANLRGKVLPIISLRHLFGFAEREANEQTRALVIDVGQPLGFIVDRVSSVVGVERNRIEDVASIRTTIDTQLLSGVIKNAGGHPMIMILDFSKLIARDYSESAAAGRSLEGSGPPLASSQGSLESINDELQLVSFDLDGQDYAIAIQDVREIVQVPEAVIHVPRAEPHVLGVMTLRNRLLPLVVLRTMFGIENRPLDEKSRIVVLAVDGGSVGVIVDAVQEVLRVPKSLVDLMPSLLAREGNLNEIAELCRLEDGKRLVSIITVSQLFTRTAVREGIQEALKAMEVGEQEEQSSSLGDQLGDDEQVVVFRLDKEEFGVPIGSVQEIVRVPDQLIRVPKTPAFVEGVINLRGSVLPVIDLRTRLGLATIDRSDRQRIMVFLIADVRTGFIVDQVAEVLRISKALIEPAPQISGHQSGLLSRMANLGKQKRMVQLLDPRQLMGSKDLLALAKVAS